MYIKYIKICLSDYQSAVIKFKFICIALSLLLCSCYPWKKNIAKIEIAYDQNANIKPGSKVNIGVLMTDSRGKRHKTGMLFVGNARIPHVEFNVQGGRVINSQLLIDQNYNNIKAHKVMVVGRVMDNPNISDTGIVILNYKGSEELIFNGDKTEAAMDRSVRLVPIKILGTGIASGKDGYTGLTGQQGLTVDIYIRKVIDSSYRESMGYDLYQVVIHCSENSQSFMKYFAPDSALFQIHADGGRGGDGGNGGPGVDGSDAKENGWRTAGGNGTNGGPGGNGGSGGNGGTIRVHLNISDKAFLNQLILSAEGGNGGNRGIGGPGGNGGINKDGTRASSGSSGQDGLPGTKGNNGQIIYDFNMKDWPSF